MRRVALLDHGAQPAAQVPPHVFNLAFQNASDSWCQFLPICGCNSVDDRIGRNSDFGLIRRADRGQTASSHLSEQMELNRMKQAATCERVHPLDRLTFCVRLQLVNCVKKKSIGTRGELL